MEGIVIIVLVMAPLGLGMLFSHLSSIKAYNEVFKEIADSLLLEFRKGSLGYAPEIWGDFEGCQIEVKKTYINKTDALFFKSTKAMTLPTDIRITRETTFSKLKRKMGIKDIETGDERFDNEMLLEASYAQALIALMNNEIRGLILDLWMRCDYLEIKNSEITAQQGTTTDIQAAAVIRMIRMLVSITQNLAQDITLEERFARNIKLDPVPQVRINNVRAMTSHPFPKAKIASTLKEALKNSSLELQVEAAKHLDNQGMNHLVKVLEKRGKSLDPALLTDIVQTLKQNNFTKSIPVLKKVYQADRGDEVKKEILKAFSTFADTGLNSFLLSALEKESPELQLYIIEALGTCGQVEAVEKLYRIGKAKFAPLTRNMVKEAIARIQSRLGDVEKGWLSVTQLQDIDGALSLTDQADEGALSISQKKQKKE